MSPVKSSTTWALITPTHKNRKNWVHKLSQKKTHMIQIAWVGRQRCPWFMWIKLSQMGLLSSQRERERPLSWLKPQQMGIANIKEKKKERNWLFFFPSWLIFIYLFIFLLFFNKKLLVWWRSWPVVSPTSFLAFSIMPNTLFLSFNNPTSTSSQPWTICPCIMVDFII